MAEETRTEEVVEQPVVTETTEVQQNDGLATALADSFFNATPVKQEIATQAEVKKEVEETKVEEPKEEEEVLDEAEYLKDLGWENKDKAKEELKQLREKAAKADQGFEFKNDDSKKIAEYINEGKIDDLYSFLDTQRKIDKLAKADLTDKNVAAELVKFGIQKDNPNLSADEIDFLFSEQYSIPKEPKQKDDELDEDFNERHAVWVEQKDRIEKKMIIEAKMAQPKLAQLKTELVLPDIKKDAQAQPQNQPTQEELARFEASKTAFLQSATQSLNSFDGFKVQVKDKDVDYTVGYAPSTEEKTMVESKLQQFVQSGFDANALFFDRWVNEDGTINQNQLVKDYMRVLTGDNADKKLVTDAVGKRMEALVATRKNININSQQQQGTFVPVTPKSEPEAVAEAWLNMR